MIDMNAVIVTGRRCVRRGGRAIMDRERAAPRINERMVRLDEVTRDVRRVGESIGGLEQILASPKLRGGLGEWTLESLLYEVLPHAHVLRQQRLPVRGVIVDCRRADRRTAA